jgi:hypothetical protein
VRSALGAKGDNRGGIRIRNRFSICRDETAVEERVELFTGSYANE